MIESEHFTYRKGNNMLNAICRFTKEEDGVAAAEYAILLGLIAVALLTAVTTFRQAIENAFGNATNALNS